MKNQVGQQVLAGHLIRHPSTSYLVLDLPVQLRDLLHPLKRFELLKESKSHHVRMNLITAACRMFHDERVLTLGAVYIVSGISIGRILRIGRALDNERELCSRQRRNGFLPGSVERLRSWRNSILWLISTLDYGHSWNWKRNYARGRNKENILHDLIIQTQLKI
jgi:hypothetical protein